MNKGYIQLKKEQELDSLYNIMVQSNLTTLDKETWLELVSDGIIDPEVMQLQIIKFKQKKVKEKD